MGEDESVVAVWVDGAVGVDEVERLLDDVAAEVTAAPAA
jgi:hypothetical protein